MIHGHIGAKTADHFRAVQSEAHNRFLQALVDDDGFANSRDRNISLQPLVAHPSLASLQLPFSGTSLVLRMGSRNSASSSLPMSYLSFLVVEELIHERAVALGLGGYDDVDLASCPR